MHRALDQPPLALDRLESHRVEIGNDQRAQLEKFEERLEQIGIGAADLEQGDILRADLRPAARLPPRRVELAENLRSEEHTSELQSLMRISYAVFCLKKKKHTHYN